MKPQRAVPTKSIWHEILNFIIHLRWHYQLFILSAGFLLGGFMSAAMNWQVFLIQFANVHLLLFGGATAYNSYWDKDKGPVGGLKNPPPMSPWMGSASLILQFIGLAIAFGAGIIFVVIYGLSVLFFTLYSSPQFRWKGSPIKSLFAIGISTGTNSVLLGYLAAGNIDLSLTAILAAFGVALIILSLYPVSQIYQAADDAARGDQTFGIKYGKRGISQFFDASFAGGLLCTTAALMIDYFYVGIVFIFIGTISGLIIHRKIDSLTCSPKDYHKVMSIKYITSLGFVGFLLLVLLIKHL